MKKPTKPVEKLVFKPVKRQTPAQKRAALEVVTRKVEIAVMELVQELRVPAQLSRMPNPFAEI